MESRTTKKVAAQAQTTPAQVTGAIREFCAAICAGQTPIYVHVQPRADSKRAGFCFLDAENQVREHGGSVKHGWIIWEWKDRFLEAEFHAVWQQPDGNLLDVSIKPEGEKTILFLPDPTLVWNRQFVPNRVHPLNDLPQVRQFVRVFQEWHDLRERHWDTTIGTWCIPLWEMLPVQTRLAVAILALRKPITKVDKRMKKIRKRKKRRKR